MMNKTANSPDWSDRTQIFTLRLWQEHLNDDHWEWRGRVQNVMSGEVFYFRDWPRLVELLQVMLRSSMDNSEIDSDLDA